MNSVEFIDETVFSIFDLDGFPQHFSRPNKFIDGYARRYGGEHFQKVIEKMVAKISSTFSDDDYIIDYSSKGDVAQIKTKQFSFYCHVEQCEDDPSYVCWINSVHVEDDNVLDSKEFKSIFKDYFSKGRSYLRIADEYIPKIMKHNDPDRDKEQKAFRELKRKKYAELSRLFSKKSEAYCVEIKGIFAFMVDEKGTDHTIMFDSETVDIVWNRKKSSREIANEFSKLRKVLVDGLSPETLRFFSLTDGVICNNAS